MTIDPWADMAVLRQCRRCDCWLSIQQFAELAHLCRGCMKAHSIPIHRIALARVIILTDKGREALREMAVA